LTISYNLFVFRQGLFAFKQLHFSKICKSLIKSQFLCGIYIAIKEIRTNMFNPTFERTKIAATFFAFSLLATLIYSTVVVTPVLAHGGEDHGESKPAAVSAAMGAVTRTVRADELEITLKHQPFAPDTEAVGKLFVTKFETNQPLGNFNLAVEASAPDGKVYEASEVKSTGAGAFTFKLPPLPEGSYTIRTRLSSASDTESAAFSDVAVEPVRAEATADVASWARTALFVLAGVLIFALLGAFLFFALRYAQRGRTSEIVGKETVSA
jgi:hypothetical protein